MAVASCIVRPDSIVLNFYFFIFISNLICQQTECYLLCLICCVVREFTCSRQKVFLYSRIPVKHHFQMNWGGRQSSLIISIGDIKMCNCLYLNLDCAENALPKFGIFYIVLLPKNTFEELCSSIALWFSIIVFQLICIDFYSFLMS